MIYSFTPKHLHSDLSLLVKRYYSWQPQEKTAQKFSSFTPNGKTNMFLGILIENVMNQKWFMF